MRMFVLAVMLTSFGGAAAAGTPPVHPGDMLRDATNARLGSIEDITADGTVALIIDSQYLHVPLASIKIVDGKAVTSMTKKQILGQ